MNNGLPAGGIDLSQAGRMPLVDHRILAPSAMEVRPNGLEIPECVAHVRVIDIPRGRAYYVPMNGRAMHALRDQFAIFIEELQIKP